MMMPPYDNDRMGEGHLQESQLKVDARAGVAVPGKLLESTSMVNTPFDLMEANTTMRPAFRADAVFGDRRDFGAAYGNVGTLASTSQPWTYNGTLHSSKMRHNYTEAAFNEARRDGIHVCVAEPGEAVWLPSYWWHEVLSEPGTAIPFQTLHDAGRYSAKLKGINGSERAFSAAVNFWFEPFHTKNFPCPKCRFELNGKSYYDLLWDLADTIVAEWASLQD